MHKSSSLGTHGTRSGDAMERHSAFQLPYRTGSGGKFLSTSSPSTVPQQIRDDIKELQQFVHEVWETRCHKCHANITRGLDVKETIMQWFNNAHSERSHTSLSTRRCEKCYAVTCLGCGEAARKGEPRKINKRYISWCCLMGRILTLWMVLCRFDTVEVARRAQNQNPKQSSRGRRSITTSSGVSGVGYAAPSSDSARAMAGRSWEPTYDISGLRVKGEDARREDFISWIMDMVTFTLPSPQSKDLLPVLLAMLELSLVIDKAAELLRNDSLDDIMTRPTIYGSVLNLVGKIGAHQELLKLVQDDRFSKAQSLGLESISFPMDAQGTAKSPQQLLNLANDDKDQSLAKCLENLAIQSKLILSISGSEPGLRRVCQKISSVHTLIKGKDGSKSAGRLPNDEWSDFHKAYSLTFNDAIRADFLPELRIEAGKTERQLQYSRTVTDRNKRILSECANMLTSLDQGTFVIVADTRPDMLRALMIGPEDTPYANGLFE